MLRVYIEEGKVTDASEYEVHSDRMSPFGPEVRLTRGQAQSLVAGLCRQARLVVVGEENPGNSGAKSSTSEVADKGGRRKGK